MSLGEDHNCAICCQTLCLPKIIFVNEPVLKTLGFVITKLDVTLLQDKQICSVCLEKLEEAYKFKALSIENLRPSENDLETLKYPDSEQNVICRLCKIMFSESSCIPLVDAIKGINIEDLISYFSIDSNVEAWQNFQVCFSCQVSLNNFHIFVSLLSVSIQGKLSDIRLNSASENVGNISNKSEIKDTEKIFFKEESVEFDTTSVPCENLTNVKEEPKESPDKNEDTTNYEDFKCKNEDVDLKMECDEDELDRKPFDHQEDAEIHKPYWETFEQRFTYNELTNIYKCDSCEYQTDNKHRIRRHMIVHKNINEIETFNCQICDFKTRYKSSINTHVLIHKTVDEIKKYSCPVCSFETKHRDSLRKHMLLHKTSEEKELFKCKSCDFQTMHKSSIIRHSSLHKESDNSVIVRCINCDYQTHCKRDLRVHSRQHKQVKQYKCQICDYQTKYKYYLKQHEMVHKNIDEIETFKCQICDFQTKHKSYINNHMLLHIDEVPMYPCSECDFQTKHKNTLRKHMIVHKDMNEMEMFKCDICEFKTKRKYTLKKHMIIHKNINEVEMFKCDDCDFQTKQKYTLKLHMIVHKNVDELTMFSCERCPFLTKRKYTLKKHMMTHEKKDKYCQD